MALHARTVRILRGRYASLLRSAQELVEDVHYMDATEDVEDQVAGFHALQKRLIATCTIAMGVGEKLAVAARTGR